VEKRILRKALLKAAVCLFCAVACEWLAPLASPSAASMPLIVWGVFLRMVLFIVLAYMIFRPSTPSGPPGLNAGISEDTGPPEMTDAQVSFQQLPNADLAARIRHDVLSPLSAAVGFVELLQEGKGGALSPRQKLYADSLFGAFQKALSAINAIADSLPDGAPTQGD